VLIFYATIVLALKHVICQEGIYMTQRANSKYEQAQPEVREAAESFWTQWVTDASFQPFNPEATDPVTFATHEVAQAAPIEPDDARAIAMEAFNKILEDVQAKQRQAA
jgi:hypothetical protein